MAKLGARRSQCRALYANSSLQANSPRGIQKKSAVATRRSSRLKENVTREGSKAHDSIRRPVEESQLQSPARTPRLKRKHIDDEDEEPFAARKRSKQERSHLEKETKAHTENTTAKEADPIEFWRREGRWPPELFEIDDKTRTYINRDLDEERWIRDVYIPNMERARSLQERPGMEHMRSVLAKKRSSSSLRRKQSDVGSSTHTSTPSDQKPREEKSATYMHPGYTALLETKNSYMKKDREGVSRECREACRLYLEKEQQLPAETLFDDALFEDTCDEVSDRNEAKVIQDISRLIVASARHLAIRHKKHYDRLTESVNEGWNNSIPLTKPRPQPDYAVGFGRSAFSTEQLAKLAPFVGTLTESSMFMATFYMYFPFLTCEVKCGAAALDIADRQNAHSMTLAVRGVVELFRLVRREKELDHQILAFSVSHDHCSVRIYGHYPVIEGAKTSYYRQTIHKFDFTALEGKEKWTAYRFTKNVYDLWMPEHLNRICSVVDALPPDLSFELSQQGDLQYQDTGLSQDFGSYSISQSAEDSEQFREGVSEASTPNAGKDTPDTSVSQPGPFKKPRKRDFSKRDA